MGFFDLFRPKWKHSDPDVRAEAVRQLDEGDLRVLSQIVRRDVDARVRRLALKKIADTELLAEIAGSDSDEALRRTAAEKADELLLHAASGADEAKAQSALSRLANPKSITQVAKEGASETVRRAALGRITEERALADVAKHADDAGIRRLAVDRLHDANVLRDVAIHDAVKEVGLAAVEKIAETAVLEVVAKRAKNKTVRDAARERLPQAMGKVQLVAQAPAEASPEARKKARRVQLIHEADAAAAIEDLQESEKKLDEIKREFAQVGGATTDEQKRFDRAASRFGARKHAHDEVERAHVQAEADKRRREEEEARSAAAREELVGKAEALDGEGIRNQVETLRTQWQALGRVPPSQAEKEARFKKATEGALKRSELALSKVKFKEKMEALALEADAIGGAGSPLKESEQKLRALQKKWRELETAGTDAELKTRLTSAEQRVEGLRAAEQGKRDAEETETITRLEELVNRLEPLATTEDRKHAEEQLKVAQAAFESAAPGRGPVSARMKTVRDRYQGVRDKVSGRLQELRDADHWKRWANVPKLEKLVERMEALRAAEGGDLKELSAQMKILQVEWKTVGAAPKEKSEALWARFKAAGDEVYKRTHEGVVKLDEAKSAESLKKKEELVLQAEALATFGESEEHKEKPPTAAEWKEQADKVKALQEEWKASGPAPREQSDIVWKKFRAACDKFFEKRNALFGKEPRGPKDARVSNEAKDSKESKDARDARDAKESIDRAENLKKLEALCEKVETLVSSVEAQKGRPGVAPKWKENAEQIKQYQADWKAAGPAPRAQSEAVWQRFRGACDKFFEMRKDAFGKADEERAGNLKKKEDLVARAEALAAGAADDREGAMKEAKALQAEWKKTGPAPKDQADAIWKKFREACDRIFDRGDRGDHVDQAEHAGAGAGGGGGGGGGGRDPMAHLTDEERKAIESYGKFENKLPLSGLLTKLKDQNAPAESAKQPSEHTEAAAESKPDDDGDGNKGA